MVITASVKAWGDFIDSGVIHDLISEISEWQEGAQLVYDGCGGKENLHPLQELGQIQGRREACADFIGMLSDLKKNFPEIYEVQLSDVELQSNFDLSEEEIDDES